MAACLSLQCFPHNVQLTKMRSTAAMWLRACNRQMKIPAGAISLVASQSGGWSIQSTESLLKSDSNLLRIFYLIFYVISIRSPHLLYILNISEQKALALIGFLCAALGKAMWSVNPARVIYVWTLFSFLLLGHWKVAACIGAESWSTLYSTPPLRLLE